MEVDVDVWCRRSLPIPTVLIVQGELCLASQFTEFAHYQVCEELSSAVAKGTDILVDLKLNKKKQSSTLDFVVKQ